MRATFSGYGGGPPIAANDLEEPEFVPKEPALYENFLADGTFNPGPYLQQGYKMFDVVCIGAAGGRGSGIFGAFQDGYDTSYINPSNLITATFGGVGGGGGYHRKRGNLSRLPASVPVVVGQPGTDGAYTPNLWYIPWYPPRPASTNGGDGGASTFGGKICQASGGKGGEGHKSTVTEGGKTRLGKHGGDGGVGGTTKAGGGALGGGKTTKLVQGTGSTRGDYGVSIPNAPYQATVPEGAVGKLNATESKPGSIGQGGGGGLGGLCSSRADKRTVDNHAIIYQYNIAGTGNAGAYSPLEPFTSGPGTTNFVVALWDFPAYILAGFGGGATIAALNGDTSMWGSGHHIPEEQRHAQGRVAIKIT